MGTAWEDPIRRTGRLTIFPGSSMTSGVWAGVIATAISEFNRISASQTLGVTLSQSTTPPDPSGVGGADVQIEAVRDTIKFKTFGQEISVTVNPKGLQGDTKQVKTVFGAVQRIAKAFIVLPADPQINANPPRAVGDGVKLVILVHELVHACGLSNSDHNPDDLFGGVPQARAGNTPPEDKIEFNNNRRMPPLLLSDETARRIRAIW